MSFIKNIKYKISNYIKSLSEINYNLSEIKNLSNKIRKKKILIIYGYSHQFYFSGLSKILTINLHKKKDFEFYYLTENIEVHNLLKSKNIPCIFWSPNFFKKKDMDILLQAKIVISEFDHSEYETCKILYSLLYGALKVQCWHGRAWGGINFIRENLNSNFISTNREFLRYLDRKSHDFLMSPLLENEIAALENMDFSFKEKIMLGNTKLDLIKQNHSEDELINVDMEILNKLKNSKKIKILICPSSPRNVHKDDNLFMFNTKYLKNSNYRDFLNDIDLDKLDKEINGNVEVYIKYHTVYYEKKLHLKNKKFNNVFIINGYSDIYPTLYYFDYLVSNWSTILYDFIFLEKPIILALNYEEFVKNDKAKRNENFFEFFKTLYNCKNINEFIKFLNNPENIIKTKKNYHKEIKELNLKFNRLSLSQKSTQEYINKLNSIMNL